MKKKNLVFVGGIFLFLIIFGIFVWGFQEERKEKSLAFLEELQSQWQEEKIVRQPVVAGQFYPADTEALEKEIFRFLDQAESPEVQGKVLSLILPHAGYQFSGGVAAYGFKILLGEDIDTVVLIGNSHTERFEGISVYPKGFFRTPLGEVEIDSELATNIIKENERIFFRESAHLKEHSLEVELPFLQKTLQNFKIVPILFGNSSNEDYKILSQALLKNIKATDKKILLIASSDLSHYPLYEDAKYADSKTIQAILTGSPEELERAIKDLEKENIPNAVTFACAKDAIKTIMAVAQEIGADEIKALKYANSGDVEIGNRAEVVGYGAVGFFQKGNPASLKSDIFPGVEKEGGLLNREQQEKLLEIARASIESFIRQGKTLQFKVEDKAFNQKLGAFVTIKKQGQLRGCIGRFSPTDIPLYQVVSQMALAAAVQDSRFYPVQKEELDELHYEISVLSNLKKIDDWKEIELGKHGVQIKKGANSGVFLPQVATENKWDLEKFMGELCSQKAGLPWDCWKQKDIELYVFTAQVFEE